MIIGLIGRLQSGKTTVAKFIEEEVERCHVIAFADFLKEMIFNAGLCTEEELWGKKTDFSRLIMQKIGSEIIRQQVDQNFWVKKMKERIDQIILDYGRLSNIIIHDVRFQNEAMLIRSYEHSAIIKITRPSLKINKEENQHISETELDNYKYANFETINDGSLEDLKTTVKKILNIMNVDYSFLKDNK